MKQFFTSLKFMLSALLLCLAIGAQAGDVVFNGSTDTNGKTDAGEDQLTKNGVTLSVSISKCLAKVNTSDFRIVRLFFKNVVRGRNVFAGCEEAECYHWKRNF